MKLRALLGLCLASAAVSCTLESAVRPQTQLVVEVDADSQVRQHADQVKLVVIGASDVASLADAQASLEKVLRPGQPNDAGTGSDASWPLRLVLAPRDGDTQRVFSFTATALDADQNFVAEVRVVSGYVANEVHYVQLELTTSCIGVHCQATETCSDGTCNDAYRDPKSVPLYYPPRDAGVADAALPDAQITDASLTPSTDAAADGGASDAGRMPNDAGDAGDAAPAVDANVPVDACSVAHGGCDVLVTCQNLDGVAVCGSCPGGYKDANGDGTSCRDIDECQTNNGGCDAVEGVCTNTPGSRDCSCKPGFHGDGVHCTVNIQCMDATPCSAQATCTAPAGGTRVCVCNDHFEGDGAQCTDIDECARKIDNCRPNSMCVNSVGSFSCPCKAGYVDMDGACIDIDECKTNVDNCDDTPDACVNDPGTFHCKCPSGYTGDGKGANSCSDINECTAGTDNCNKDPSACVNDPGTFHCTCPIGYAGTGIGVAGCLDVNECLVLNGGCDSHRMCVNTPGSHSCGTCDSGFTPTGTTGCTDVNECITGNGGCDPLRVCMNTQGTRACGDCPTGYANMGATGCMDVDECATSNGGCDMLRTCTNTAGGFTCSDCPAGYTDLGALGCSDVNECMTNNGGCAGLRSCTNTMGGFMCGNCPAGYTNNGATDCTDIDECATNNGGCSTMRTCTNTMGGFTCSDCPAGYTNDGALACLDVNECNTNNGGCDVKRTCTNTAGSFTCGDCPAPFYMNDGALGCADVNECATNNGGCVTGQTCNNLVGMAPTCSCATNFSKDATMGCIACAACMYSDGTTASCSAGTKSVSVPGAAGDFDNTVTTQPASTLFAYQFTLAAPAVLDQLFISKTDSGDASARLGLYTNGVSGPGMLMASTTSLPLSGVGVTPSSPITGAGACLPAGTYWIAGIANGTIGLGKSSTITASFVSTLVNDATMLPTNWPSGASVIAGAAVNDNSVVQQARPSLWITTTGP